MENMARGAALTATIARLAAASAVVVFLTGCGQPATAAPGSPVPPPPRSGSLYQNAPMLAPLPRLSAGGRPARYEPLAWSLLGTRNAGRVLVLGIAYGGCTQPVGVLTKETDATVTIGIYAKAVPKGQRCTTQIRLARTTIQLDQPIGHRKLFAEQ